MACSCSQCTGRSTAGETFAYEMSGVAEESARGQRPPNMGWHARLGAGRSIPAAVPDREVRTGGFHRSLGAARRSATAQTGELELVGIDERQQVTNTGAVPFRWMCAIDMIYPDPDVPGAELHFPPASGTLISPRHVLTAGHLLFDDVTGSLGNNTRRLQVNRVVVTPGRNGSQTPLVGSSISSNVIYTDSWRASLDFRFDYGLITLPDALGDRHSAAIGGPLGFWGSPTSGSATQIVPVTRTALQNQPVNISGYPADKPLGTQWRASGQVTSTNPHAASELIYYSLDTCAGHSGSPVWTLSGTTRNIVAIHTGPCIAGPDCSPQPGPICFPDGQQVTSNRGIYITASVMADVARWMGGSGSGLPAPGPRPIVRFGSRGATVQELQTRLNIWIARTPGVGLAPLVADGEFGAKTLAAVRAFQRSRGLQVDGVVGPLTWGALFTV